MKTMTRHGGGAPSSHRAAMMMKTPTTIGQTPTLQSSLLSTSSSVIVNVDHDDAVGRVSNGGGECPPGRSCPPPANTRDGDDEDMGGGRVERVGVEPLAASSNDDDGNNDDEEEWSRFWGVPHHHSLFVCVSAVSFCYTLRL